MGMFDTVRCLYPLPVSVRNPLDFQTKSLDCFLDTYEIRTDGSLWKLYGNAEWQPEPYTGAITFYTMEDDRWIELVALFERGRLVSIVDRGSALATGEEEVEG